MKAMILAAGLGTRLKPFTDLKPKVLFRVHDHTLLEWTIRYLKKFGIDEIIVNVHHFSDQVIKVLKENKGFGLPFVISDETDQLMNTAGAIVKAADQLKRDGPFVLMGTDVITGLDLGEMIRFHKKNKPLVTLAVKDRPTTRSLLFNDRMELMGWRDNHKGTTIGENELSYKCALGFSTIHIIEPEIFKYIQEKGAFSIIDLYLRIMTVHRIMGFRHDSDAWFEFGRSSVIDANMNDPELIHILDSL